MGLFSLSYENAGDRAILADVEAEYDRIIERNIEKSRKEKAQMEADLEAGKTGPCPILARIADRGANKEVVLPWMAKSNPLEEMTEFRFRVRLAQREGWISAMLADAVYDNIIKQNAWSRCFHPDDRKEIVDLPERFANNGLTNEEARIAKEEAEKAALKEKLSLEFKQADSRFGALSKLSTKKV